LARFKQVYFNWNNARLGPSNGITARDSYWFSYVSTTTIGFGDFYVAPEVLVVSDLFLYPIILLVGFIFFSAFLGRLAELLSAPSQAYGRSLVDQLAKDRETTTAEEAHENDHNNQSREDNDDSAPQDSETLNEHAADPQDVEGEHEHTVKVPPVTSGDYSS
jgi:hypothetical protein